MRLSLRRHALPRPPQARCGQEDDGPVPQALLRRPPAGKDLGRYALVRQSPAKCPLDLWVYQEIVAETRPDLVVETGTFEGGSALFFASLFDLLGEGNVVTVDIEPRERPPHDRITYLTGSSTAPEIVDRIKAHVAGASRQCARRARLRPPAASTCSASSRRVRGLRDARELPDRRGHERQRPSGRSGVRTGPTEALERFLDDDDRFVVDRSQEKFLLTFNPGGFLAPTVELASRLQSSSTGALPTTGYHACTNAHTARLPSNVSSPRQCGTPERGEHGLLVWPRAPARFKLAEERVVRSRSTRPSRRRRSHPRRVRTTRPRHSTEWWKSERFAAHQFRKQCAVRVRLVEDLPVRGTRPSRGRKTRLSSVSVDQPRVIRPPEGQLGKLARNLYEARVRDPAQLGREPPRLDWRARAHGGRSRRRTSRRRTEARARRRRRRASRLSVLSCGRSKSSATYLSTRTSARG